MRIDSILHRIARFDSAVHRETNEKKREMMKRKKNGEMGRGGGGGKGKKEKKRKL